MKKNPLYLIPLLAFALVMPPALTPQAAFAGSLTAGQVSPDQNPQSGKWTKIAITRSDAAKFEARTYYAPGSKSFLDQAPTGTSNYRRLYLRPDTSDGAISTLWYGKLKAEASKTWAINWFFGSDIDGHRHLVINRDATVTEIVIPVDPSAGIPKDVWDAVTNADPKASDQDKRAAALALAAAKQWAGESAIGAEIVNEFKKRGPGGLKWAADLYKQQGGDAQKAGGLIIQAFANDAGGGDLATRIATAVSNDTNLTKLLAGLTPTTVPPIDNGVAIGVGKNQAAEKIENPLVKRMGEGLSPGEGAAEISNAVTEFIWEAWENDSKSFVKSKTREMGPAKGTLQKSVQTWIESAITDEERRHGVIVFFMGLGSKTVPQWIEKDEVAKTILTGAGRGNVAAFKDFPKNMRNCMDHWSAEKASEEAPRSPAGCFAGTAGGTVKPQQLGMEHFDTWTASFLLEAVGHANLLLAAVNKDPGQLAKEINGASGSVEDPTGGAGDREGQDRERDNRISAEKSMGMEELFGKYGDSFKGRDGKNKALNNVFRIDGREFALVVRTVPKFVQGADGQTHQVLTNQVGLYDVSRKYDIVGKRFDLKETGDHKITLPGRKRQYVLTIPADRSQPIGFKPVNLAEGEDGKLKVPAVAEGTPYPKPGEGGKWLDHKVIEGLPSMDDLFRARTQRAMASANEVTIGGKTYKVTGESAGTGNFLYWDPAQLAKMENSEQPWFDQPTMVARVNKVGNNGLEFNTDPKFGGMAPVGQDGNGDWWGLKWIPTAGGQGFYQTVKLDKAPTPDAPPADPGSGNPTEETPGNGNPQAAPRTPQGGIDWVNLSKNIPEGHRIGGTKAFRTGDFHFISNSDTGKQGLIEYASASGGDTAVMDKDVRKQYAAYQYLTAYEEALDVSDAGVVRGDGKNFLFVKDAKGGFVFWDLATKANTKTDTGRVLMFQGMVKEHLLVNGGVTDTGVLVFLLDRPDGIKEGGSLTAAIKALSGPTFEKFKMLTGSGANRMSVAISKAGTTGIECVLDFEGGKWKVRASEGCDPTYTPGDNTNGPAQSVVIDTKDDKVSAAQNIAKLPQAPSNPMEQGGKEYALLKAGVAGSGVYFRAKDASSPAEIKVRFSVAEAAAGQHITADHSEPQFIMYSMDGFMVVGGNIAPDLKKKVEAEGAKLTAADLPADFQVGAISLPAGFTWDDVVGSSGKFRPKVIGAMTKEEGGMVLMGKVDGKTESCVGWIAVWGGIKPADACKKAG